MKKRKKDRNLQKKRQRKKERKNSKTRKRNPTASFKAYSTNPLNLKAYHNTNAENVQAIVADGYLRSNAQLKARGAHPPHWRTGDPSVPVTDENAIFFYPYFAQYSLQRVTYGVNLEEIREEVLRNLGEDGWNVAQQNRYSAFVFDAEVLIEKYGGRLRIDSLLPENPLGYDSNVVGRKAISELGRLRSIANRNPHNNAFANVEILVEVPVSLKDCLEFIEDSALDYRDKTMQ